MPFNFEVNNEFIEARYVAGENQYDLELFAAAPDIVSFGSGESSSFSTNAVLIEPTAGPIRGGLGCPRLDQFVLIVENGIVLSKQVEFLTTEDYCYHPIKKTAHRVIQREIMLRQPCYLVQSVTGASGIASGSQPLIADIYDESGTAITKLVKNQPLMSWNFAKGAISSLLATRNYVGIFDTMSISLENGHIFGCGLSAKDLLLFHNIKPFPEDPVF